ncbi:MAG TPA: translocation/assembly module TamB domain-containing protein, partial [Polyangiaceae bacterium]
SVRATPVGAEVIVSRFGTIARGLRGADLRGIASMRLRAPGFVWTSFDGHFGDVQLGALVRVDGERLTASLEVPRARPAEVRALLPEYPLHEDASVQLEAAGTLPVVSVRGRLNAGDGRILTTGALRLQDGLAMDLEAEGTNVDLRMAFPDAPETRLDVRARVGVDARSGALLTLDATTAPTRIAGLELPAADLAATLDGGVFEGTGKLHEPGAPLDVRFRVEPDGTARVDAEAKQIRLERAPRLAALLSARGVADARASAVFEAGAFVADGTLDLRDMHTGELNVARGAISGRVQGRVDRPGSALVDAAVAGSGVRFGELSFARVAGAIKGPLATPKVQATLDGEQGPRIHADATFRSLPDGARVEGLSLSVRRGRAELRGVAERVEVRDQQLDLRNLELTGLGGTLRGSARIAPDFVAVDAEGRELNLAALSGLLGLNARPRGRVTLDADVVLARDVERGTTKLVLEDVAFGAVDGLTATIEARLERDRLEADAHAELAHIGSAEARLRGTLAGSALKSASFRDMTGEAELSLAELDLGFLGTLLAAQGTVESVAGKLTTRAKFTRVEPEALPDLALTAFTQGVEVRLPPSPEGPRAPLTGLNLLFGANLSGKSGDSDVSAQLVDASGSLAAASVSGTLDLAELRTKPQRLGAQILTTPVTGKLLIGERSLSDLPEWLRPPAVRGRVRADVTLSGTLAEPELSGRLALAAFGLENARNQRPVDFCANASFDPKSGELSSSGEAFLSQPNSDRCTGSRVLRYAVNGRGGRDAAGDFRPRGSIALALEGFPLDAVPGLGDAEISGSSHGTASLDGTDGTAHLVASLELRDTRVQGVPVGTGKLRIQSDERSIGATLSLAQQGGQLTATALGSVDASGVLPNVNLKAPLFLRVSAERMDAVVLAPVLRDVLSEIGGRVDGDVTATLIQQTSGENAGELGGAIQGRVALDDGDVQLAGLGLRLSDVTLKARAESVDDQTRITVEELGGRGGRSGQRVTVRDGQLWLRGLRLSRAEGTVETTELPLMLEGVEQATATTRQGIRFELERKAEAMQVSFDVPYLLVALPQSTGRDVISLEENASIEVLQPLGEPVRRSGEGLPWVFSFELGQNVRLTRTDLDLPLTGKAEVRLADAVTVQGDLELKPGGRLQVSDRMFVIESGEVHFNTGDPANPTIRVTATWRAPDDTTVFATVSGTLKEPQLLPLTSSPSRTQDEIWALLLGYGGSSEDAAPGAAGAIVGAQQLLAPILQNTP